jgi:SPW repeat
VSTTYTPERRSARENYWQDWANAIIAVWFFISPWILQFGAGAPAMAGDTATTAVLGSVQAAAWNAWVLSVMVLLVAISAIGRMDFWQEYMNIALSFWIFIAPWVLGFTLLPRASWDHWIIGALTFLFSISVLSRARQARMVSTTSADPPVNRRPGAI